MCISMPTPRVHTAGVCPRCQALADQLRYWREREWYKKIREERLKRERERRNSVVVNTNSGWAGSVIYDSLPTNAREMGYAVPRAGAAVAMAAAARVTRPTESEISVAASAGALGACAAPGARAPAWSRDVGCVLIMSSTCAAARRDPGAHSKGTLLHALHTVSSAH
jgi:Zn ribbon nucleic-acid-binding protein